MLIEYIIFIGVVAFLIMFFGEYSRNYWFCAVGGLLILFLGVWMLLDGTGIQYQSGYTSISYNSSLMGIEGTTPEIGEGAEAASHESL